MSQLIAHLQTEQSRLENIEDMFLLLDIFIVFLKPSSVTSLELTFYVDRLLFNNQRNL